jgi:hypothetical protein
MQGGGTTSQTNLYHGTSRSMVGLANFYVDLGTFCQIGCLTPYVGAGFGFAHTTVSGFTDTSTGFNSVTGATGSLGGYASTVSRTSFAWALMAGVGYKVNERLTLEAGYRYLSLGDMPALLLRDPATGLAARRQRDRAGQPPDRPRDQDRHALVSELLLRGSLGADRRALLNPSPIGGRDDGAGPGPRRSRLGAGGRTRLILNLKAPLTALSDTRHRVRHGPGQGPPESVAGNE